MFLKRSLVKNLLKNKLSAAKLQPLTKFIMIKMARMNKYME